MKNRIFLQEILMPNAQILSYGIKLATMKIHELLKCLF